MKPTRVNIFSGVPAHAALARWGGKRVWAFAVLVLAVVGMVAPPPAQATLGAQEFSVDFSKCTEFA